ncbi:MAG: serine/threonine-protein kinase [Microthrixaceae bacterium]
MTAVFPGRSPPACSHHRPITEPLAARATTSWARWSAREELGDRGVELRVGERSLLAAARAQARLDCHPGVVSVHQALEGDGDTVTVQFEDAGPTWATHLAQRAAGGGAEVAAADVAAVGSSIAEVLAQAHSLVPPLVHGAIDGTAIRLDRWGHSRLDGFDAQPEHAPGVEATRRDVADLVDTLLDALGSPAAAAPNRRLAALLVATRQRAAALDASHLASGLARFGPGPSHPTRSLATGRTITERSAPAGVDDRTVGLASSPALAVCPPLPLGLVPQERLAVGGHGELWRAHDPLLSRDVVVKLFRQSSETGVPRAMAREIGALAALDGHRAAVTCYGQQTGAHPALVLGWCAGGPLRTDIARSAAQVAQLGAHVADALGMLHAQGLVHGDVKPQNLLVDRWGAVRLADFSVTRPAGSAAAPECSPRHAPPEQLAGEALHPGVDVAALAATLFHLAECRPPLERGDGTDALVARRLAGEREAPSAVLGALPEVAEWVQAALAPDPSARPPGGAVVAAATIRAALRDGGTRASPAAQPGRRTGASRRSGRTRRAPARGAAAAIVVVAVGVTLGALGGVGLAGDSGGSAPAQTHRTTEGPLDPVASAAMEAALALGPPDPLGAEAPGDFSLSVGPDGSALLTLSGEPDGRDWLVRRDDFAATGGLVDAAPSASGVVGADGTLAGSPQVISGRHSSLALPAARGMTSCVRVVSVHQPPTVSPSRCWD